MLQPTCGLADEGCPVIADSRCAYRDWQVSRGCMLGVAMALLRCDLHRLHSILSSLMQAAAI